jgi:predicted ferric reductase
MANTATLGHRTRAGRPPAVRLRGPVRRAWWKDAVGVGVWASMLVVTALWVSNGGVQGLTAGAGSAFTSFGRLLGLISSDLLLLQVLAMARIPWVERALGQDSITRWHRLLGFTSVNLLLAHAVFITIGYAALGKISFLPELWSLVTTAPGMLLATAGTGLFVLIMVTSIRAARRRMRYESWHLLHLYAYLGAGLALPHQLWTGADFISSPIATAYWWGLYAFALASVLVFRVALPLARSGRHVLTVSAVVPEAPGVVSVHMTGPRLAQLTVAPGQFFVWRFLTRTGWTRGHPLSLSAAPTSHGLRVTVGVRGDDGDRIKNLKPGTRVLMEGPYGKLTPDARTRRGLIAVGSGLGIAPLIAVLQDAASRSRTVARPMTLVRRVSSEDQTPLQADIDALVAAGHLRVLDLVGPRSRTGTAWLPSHLGHVAGPKAVKLLVPDFLNCDVYVCGAAPWVEAVSADLSAAGVPADALHIEQFTW